MNLLPTEIRLTSETLWAEPEPTLDELIVAAEHFCLIFRNQSEAICQHALRGRRTRENIILGEKKYREAHFIWKFLKEQKNLASKSQSKAPATELVLDL